MHVQRVAKYAELSTFEKVKLQLSALFPFLFTDVANYQAFAVSRWARFLTQFNFFEVSTLWNVNNDSLRISIFVQNLIHHIYSR